MPVPFLHLPQVLWSSFSCLSSHLSAFLSSFLIYRFSFSCHLNLRIDPLYHWLAVESKLCIAQLIKSTKASLIGEHLSLEWPELEILLSGQLALEVFDLLNHALKTVCLSPQTIETAIPCLAKPTRRIISYYWARWPVTLTFGPLANVQCSTLSAIQTLWKELL